MNQYTSKELDAVVATKEVVLIDVREVSEYKEGHIKGSKNIPLSLLPLKLQDVVRSKDDAIVVQCLSGGRSAQAKQYLNRQGYVNVVDFGGIYNYEGPLVKGV